MKLIVMMHNRHDLGECMSQDQKIGAGECTQLPLNHRLHFPPPPGTCRRSFRAASVSSASPVRVRFLSVEGGS